MMKPSLRLFLIAAFCLPTHATAEEHVGWERLAEIEAEIIPPEFPDRDFPIADFGAVSDGATDCREAIAQAIEACHTAGGGRVVISAGTWFVAGPIHLKSNVNLHLQKGVTVKFSTEPSDYLPVVFTRFEGTELMNYSPLIYAYEQENIAVTGQGTLDGQASRENWWRWSGDRAGDIAKVRGMADDGVAPEERIFGEGHLLRPNFIQPYRSKNILIEGVTIIGSPMWIVHPVLSENVTVRNLRIESHGSNNDGCNPESCRNVLIENCLFDTGDDCIAIKSGRNTDGRRIGVPSERIIVRGCQMKDGHGGVVLGSEMSGDIRDVFVEDCQMDSPNLERAIRIKSSSLRGGVVENLFVRNVQVGEVSDAVFRINLHYFNEYGDYDPVVRNIVIENVTAEKTTYPFYFRGLESSKIENVLIKNCTIRGAAKPSIIEHVKSLVLEDFQLLPE